MALLGPRNGFGEKGLEAAHRRKVAEHHLDLAVDEADRSRRSHGQERLLWAR